MPLFCRNIIDIIAHALLSITTILHIVDISSHTEALALWTARWCAIQHTPSLTRIIILYRVACFGLLFIWSRLLIFARASEFFGKNWLIHT